EARALMPPIFRVAAGSFAHWRVLGKEKSRDRPWRVRVATVYVPVERQIFTQPGRSPQPADRQLRGQDRAFRRRSRRDSVGAGSLHWGGFEHLLAAAEPERV